MAKKKDSPETETADKEAVVSSENTYRISFKEELEEDKTTQEAVVEKKTRQGVKICVL